LCCAVIGFIYAAIGGSAIYTITNPNGREFYFYLTTFTVTNYSGFIRPSAFFDEPGALSFYICFVVMLREILWPRKRALNFALLAFGIVTLSLAHIVFTILYVIYCLIT
ncbi:TPA: O170 family O-antigen polymerase, partial [Escherichia coli]|nr:O170 family O-antigen polymerase [Escherichia coli]